MLKLYNSLSKRVETFKPVSGKNVKMYACGPTVYARPHIGNFRTYVFEDVVKRYLLFLGYSVKHAMNITDFDNTIIREAKKTGIQRARLVKKYERLFLRDVRTLGILPVDAMPRVSGSAERMADAVVRLLRKKMAYKNGKGRVFFDVSKFKSYGKLAGITPKPDMKVTWEEYRPARAGDFLLWDPCRRKAGQCFDSKLGRAHPAWNMHCAVMSLATLGGPIDISMGGKDNLFNHHENTRAVAGALCGREYSKYWMHVRHLIIGGRKMSKRKGNVVLMPDLTGMGYSPKMVRMFLLSKNYMKRLNFSWERMREVKGRHLRMKKAVGKIKRMGGEGSAKFERVAAYAERKFAGAMDGNFNAPKAIGVAEKFVMACAGIALSKKQAAEAIALLEKFDSVLYCLPV